MDCKTGTLIDFSEPPETGQELEIPVTSCSPSRSSLLGETSRKLILNEQLQLGTALENIAHSSPLCGVLIDLNFSGVSPNNGSGLAETSIQFSENSLLVDQNSGLTLQEKSTAGSSHLKNEKCSSNGNRNFSWSPSVICKDADLLENEEFDFNFMSSLSPERESISLTDKICSECTSQKKATKLSTSLKDWSLLNDAFISKISEEAAKVVTCLSAKKVFPGKPEKISSPNSSFSVTWPNDLCVKNLNSLLDDSVMGSSSSNNGVNFQCTNKNNSEIDVPFVKSYNEFQHDITEVAGKSANTRTGSSESLDDCIMSNLNALETADIENKENIPVGETEIGVFSDNSSESSNYIVKTEELVEEQLSPALKQKCKILSSPSKETSPLIRRETFTMKTNPFQESIKSISKCKTVGNTGDRREKAKVQFSTPKGGTPMRQPTVSCRSSVFSKKTDLASQGTLTRKGIYTISTGSNATNLYDIANQTSSNTSYSTPNAISRISSFAGKMKSLSCKVTKSKCESSPPGKIISSSNSPKGTSACTKTPITPKRKSLLPSKLISSQSRATFHSKTSTSASAQHSSAAVTKSSSFRLSAGPSLAGSVSKRSVFGTKQRANSADEIANFELNKRSMPLKAIAPVSRMIKAASIKSPEADVSHACGNKGKTTPSLASQGLSGRVKSVPMSEPAKGSNFHGTPKSGSARSRPRFSSQNDSTPPPLKNNVRRSSFLPTPKRLAPKQSSEKF